MKTIKQMYYRFQLGRVNSQLRNNVSNLAETFVKDYLDYNRARNRQLNLMVSQSYLEKQLSKL